MERIKLLEKEQVSENVQDTLDNISHGARTINIFKAMANSSAVLNMFAGIAGALKEASIPAEISERIAVRLAIINNCEYCLAAHSYAASKVLPHEEVLAARVGKSADAKAQTALLFAESVMKNAGHVSDEEFQSMREAGFTDGEILEVVAIVSLNFFTNAINGVSQTKVDFPKPKE